MAQILRVPARLTNAQKKTTVTLFLAGPFEPDDGLAERPRSWRDDVIDACADLPIVIVDPRSQRWPLLAPGSPGRSGALSWQTSLAYEADVVIVWIPEGRHAPTALMILGYLAAKRGNARLGSTVVVGGGAWDGLVTAYAQNQRLFPMGNDLSEVVRVARIQLKEAIGAKTPKGG